MGGGGQSFLVFTSDLIFFSKHTFTEFSIKVFLFLFLLETEKQRDRPWSSSVKEMLQ